MEAAINQGRIEALTILVDAASRCRLEDVRTPDVTAAIDYLEKCALRRAPFQVFRNSLDIDDPAEPEQEVRCALVLITGGVLPS